ncbi:MAG TPA: hypothetical protein PLK28_18905 [Candidatus Rifleibacterium sp.]|jgi:hypothetical protein|nr:hypothetical protein [Candidatus Rifleibacterium sp.]
MSGLIALVMKAGALREQGRQALLKHDYSAARACYFDSLQIHNHRQGRVGLLLALRLLKKR